MTRGPGIKPGSHWWEPNALITAPSLLPASQLHYYTTPIISQSNDILGVVLLALPVFLPSLINLFYPNKGPPGLLP